MDIFDARAARVMLIAGESEPFDSNDYSFELKMDGERCLAYLDGTGTYLVNRRGREVLWQLPELSRLHELAGRRCIIDGEMVVGEGRKEEFELIKQRSQAKREATIQRLAEQQPCTFVALDILYHDGLDLTGFALTERRTVLGDAVREGERLSIVRPVERRGIAFFDVVRKEGLEGIVAKRNDSRYLMGKRTREWTKIKNWLEDDFIICGYVPNARAAVVSLLLGQYTRDGLLLYKGRTTLGTRRDDFGLVQKIPQVKQHPFTDIPEGAAEAVWIKPVLVCRVGFMCWTASLRLRQPFFKELLPDKPGTSVLEPDAPATC